MSGNEVCTPKHPQSTDMWQRLACEKRPIVVYGMGNGADKLFSRFEKYGIKVADVFASDGFVRGHSYRGMRVKSFSEILAEYPDLVIVLSFATRRDEVLSLIESLDKNYELYIPDMPVAGEEYFDAQFYNAHYDELCRAAGLMCDEESLSLLWDTVSYKLTGKLEYLSNTVTVDSIYSLLPRESIRTAIDAGAYNGDTAKEMKSYFPSLKKIYAIEPDKRNFKKLLKYSEAESDIEIVPISAAVWDEDGVSRFYDSGNRNSSLTSTLSYEHRESDVPTIMLDTLTKDKIDYIKYDVEGAEFSALRGSLELIRRTRPALLVSLYHRSRDLFEIPLMLAEELLGYRFYLRRLRCVPAWELNLILIPEQIHERQNV